jgi:hypothetical protein
MELQLCIVTNSRFGCQVLKRAVVECIGRHDSEQVPKEALIWQDDKE